MKSETETPNAEKIAGIENYITTSRGIKGILRSSPESFYVEEISKLPDFHEDGKFTILRVKKANWDTLNFVRMLSRILRISQKRIEFAGTKDKRAVTVQYFSISNLNDEQIKNLKNLKVKDAEIEVLGKARRPIRLGDLFGNFFRISVLEIEDDDTEITLREIEEKGVPNFFGLQRFGTIRFVTHEVGRHILRSDFESAFWTYVAKPFQNESEEVRKIREEIWNTRDARIGLKVLPDYLRYERSLLQKFQETGSEEKAILSLPKSLKMMFTHAYQSYVFNRLLSERIREFKTLKFVEKDDFAEFVKFEEVNGKKYLRLMEDCSKVTEINRDRIEFLIRRKRGFLALPIPGFETDVGEGWATDKIREVLEEDEIEFSNFKSKYKEFSSRGGYRVADMPYTCLNISIEDKNAIFTFYLLKGCYATSFLREFTKSTQA
ncbi:MAG TPA: tRNA pseudouridine(13) synthase TruD [Archaeoglobaceae archaeon]|nr:tRNA pseudouridine(13) synthase TruD [Archaeoglobaceae archaeon]